jgi:hypothetical protein
MSVSMCLEPLVVKMSGIDRAGVRVRSCHLKKIFFKEQFCQVMGLRHSRKQTSHVLPGKS